MLKKILIAIFLILLLSYPCFADGWFYSSVTAGGGYATPAFVTGQAAAGIYPTTTITLPGNSTSGNTLVVYVTSPSTLASTSLGSGGGVTTWYSTIQVSATGYYSRWFYGTVGTGGAVSITPTNFPIDGVWGIVEVSGVASGDSIDQTAGQETEFSTSWTSGNTPTTTQTYEILIGGIATNATFSATPTWDTGWTQRVIESDHYLAMGTRVVTTTGAYAASGTDTSYTTGIASILTLKAASL